MSGRYRDGDMTHLSARLQHRLAIEEAVDVADGAGGFTRSWQPVATVWAEVEPLSGGSGERVMQSQQVAQQAYRIVIRYRDDVDTTMRLGWKNKLAAMTEIRNPVEANISLEITAIEGVAP